MEKCVEQRRRRNEEDGKMVGQERGNWKENTTNLYWEER
jgi:hypothetical protein